MATRSRWNVHWVEAGDVDGAQREHMRHTHEPEGPLARGLAFGEIFQVRQRDVGCLPIRLWIGRLELVRRWLGRDVFTG